MNYPKFTIPSLSRLAQICRFSIALSAIALFSADLAQAERFTPTIKPNRPVYPFPGVTNEVTPQCKVLMTSIKDMIYVSMNHMTLNNIRGNASSAYSEAFLRVNNDVVSGSGRRLLSDRFVNHNTGQSYSQAFDIWPPQKSRFRILGTKSLLAQAANLQLFQQQPQLRCSPLAQAHSPRIKL
jgi:hypothetical protein